MGKETTSAGFNSVDQVTNTASTGGASATYFVAIPSQANSATWPVADCGACVKLNNNGKTLIATVVDECPTVNGENPPCLASNHLDLSTAAFAAEGYPSNGGNLPGSWQFIACPVTGTIQAIANSVVGNQYFFENSVYPISTVNGQGPTINGGFFTVAPGTVTIASASAGVTITGVLPSGGGNVGVQFTRPVSCQ